jgi:hypothetical protein
MRKISSVVTAVALVAGLLATWAGGSSADEAATAGTVRSRVSISFDSSEHDFEGRVRSTAGVCKRKRKIRVFMVHDGPDMLAAAGRTNRRGRYDVNHSAGGEGNYYAKALRKVSGSKTCKRARSKTIDVQF